MAGTYLFIFFCKYKRKWNQKKKRKHAVTQYPRLTQMVIALCYRYPYAKKEKGRDSITESRPLIINSQHLFIRFCMYSYVTLWYHLLYLSVYIIAQRVDILKV